MNYLKLIIKNLGIMFLVFLIGMLLLTILSYFDIIGAGTLSILEIILTLSVMIIGGFLTGKKSKSKGWLEGIKMGLIYIFIIFILGFILTKGFSFKSLFYYLILIISSMLGGMIGILKK